MKLFVTIMAFIAFFCGASAMAQDYDVRIDVGPSPHAHVDARLLVSDRRLFVHSHAGGYEWSDYIRNLQVFAADGRPINVTKTGKSEWSVAVSSLAPLNVTYDVDFAFTVAVREGAQRGGQWFKDCLYLVNRALFVMSDAPGARDIAFHLPTGAQIASPWTQTGPSSFRAASNDDLVDNTTVVGSFPHFNVDDGPFHITFTLPGAHASDRDLVEPVVRKVMHEYLRIFPDTPPYKILMAYFQGVEVNGEAYRDSATLTFPEPINSSNRDLWANYIAHELFHHWNPHLVAGDKPQQNVDATEWFSEGGTEYVSNRTLVRTKIIGLNAWLRHVESNIALYKFWTWAAAFSGTSLSDAATHTALVKPAGVEAKTYNRAGIYNGGWVAAFCIDAKIAVATGGQKDIDDLFRLLRRRFGSKGLSWSNNDLISVASDVAGRDLHSEMSPYFDTPTSIPIKSCLADAGLAGFNLDYSGETEIWPDPGAAMTNQRVLARMVNQ